MQHRFTTQVSGMGGLPYEERLRRLGLTTLQARRERGDMIEAYKIITGKVDVDPAIWFNPLTNREGASSTRSSVGQLNQARRVAKSEQRLHQFSVRVVPKWNALPDQVKTQPTLNFFKNAYDNMQM